MHAQTPQEESVTKLETPCWLSLVLICKSDVNEVNGNMSNPMFEKKTVDRNTVERWINPEAVSHTVIISYQVISGAGQSLSGRGKTP